MSRFCLFFFLLAVVAFLSSAVYAQNEIRENEIRENAAPPILPENMPEPETTNAEQLPAPGSILPSRNPLIEPNHDRPPTDKRPWARPPENSINSAPTPETGLPGDPVQP